MKIKRILLVSGLLIAFTAKSQGITGSEEDTLGLDTRPISFPFWIAKEIALDLSEKEQLEQLQAVSLEEISLLRSLVSGLEEQLHTRSLQRLHLEKQLESLQVSLKAERLKKAGDPFWKRALQIAGAFGIGYVIGSSNR